MRLSSKIAIAATAAAASTLIRKNDLFPSGSHPSLVSQFTPQPSVPPPSREQNSVTAYSIKAHGETNGSNSHDHAVFFKDS